MILSLLIPSFIAGVLTFLAPCTLPLVPGYLGFISGVSLDNVRSGSKAARVRWKILLNGLLYVIGFSVVFVALGSLVGLGGSLLASYRLWLSRIGGLFVIFFGLYMLGIVRLPALKFLQAEHRFSPARFIKPGNPASSLIFGAAFAFGWTPCVGPVLGAVLTLAATSATAMQGSILLGVFALGLAVPFLAVAAGIGSAARYLNAISRYVHALSVVGGIFLLFLGVLLATNSLGIWIGFFFRVFGFINYEGLLEYL